MIDNNLFKYYTRQMHTDFTTVLSLFLFASISFGPSLSPYPHTAADILINMLGSPNFIDCEKLSVYI